MSELRTNKIIPRDGIPAASSGTRIGGGMIQVVYAQKKDAQTIPGAGGGSAGDDVDISGLSFTIQPSSSSSLILLQATIHHYVDANQQMGFTLKANNSTITDALGDADSGGSSKRQFASGYGNQGNADNWVIGCTSFSYLHAPATTSAITYKVCLNMATTSGTSYINRSERDYDGTHYDYRTVSTFMGMEVSG
tara:strand:- start:1047 stop:1625 length:579 start_codon:yes stop_codon:yes gene_type:complete